VSLLRCVHDKEWRHPFVPGSILGTHARLAIIGWGPLLTLTQQSLGGGEAIALGTAIVGCADALDAILFFGLRNGVPPGRIFQSIASGLLGQASYAGGTPTVALGVLLHFTIACGIVTTYFLASRRIAACAAGPPSAASCTGS
jgi:hypothetical protein